MRRLILFDVDGTLIKRGDPDHLGAMDHGVHSVFPEAKDATVTSVDYDGKVDRLIATEILAQAGISLSAEDPALDRVFDLAGEYYRDRWAGKPGGLEDLLPGVAELVPKLAMDDAFALGVLTGGSRGIVAVKLERLGLVESFPVGSFGNEVPNRPALVPLALERAAAYFGEVFEPEQVVIVGDTPADVNCAHVHGIPCLGVATGKYSVEAMRAVGADEVLPDLSAVSAVRELLLTIEYQNG
ncbi:MAG: HAD family hydrolase [Sphaerobacteraceae bacterium]|nr:MAG: HAD family hydrolase [Sphaerobacteraceae bacterium]